MGGGSVPGNLISLSGFLRPRYAGGAIMELFSRNTQSGRDPPRTAPHYYIYTTPNQFLRRPSILI
jgi:hypothetical protein